MVSEKKKRKNILGEKCNQQIHAIVFGVQISDFEEDQAGGSYCWQSWFIFNSIICFIQPAVQVIYITEDGSLGKSYAAFRGKTDVEHAKVP